LIITGSLILSVIIAIVMISVMMHASRWWLRLIFFIIGLGAANIAMGIVTPGVGWTLFINTLLFGGVGVYSIRKAGLVNRVVGVIFVIIAIALLIPSINAFGYQTPKTIWGALTDSAETGWRILLDTLQKVFAKT